MRRASSSMTMVNDVTNTTPRPREAYNHRRWLAVRFLGEGSSALGHRASMMMMASHHHHRREFLKAKRRRGFRSLIKDQTIVPEVGNNIVYDDRSNDRSIRMGEMVTIGMMIDDHQPIVRSSLTTIACVGMNDDRIIVQPTILWTFGTKVSLPFELVG